MTEPAVVPTAPAGAERAPWSMPRLARLDADATAHGGLVVSAGGDSAASSA